MKFPKSHLKSKERISRVDIRNQELLKTLEYSNGESDRGLVICSASHIDQILRNILESFLINSKEVSSLFDDAFAPLSSLSGKAKMAYCMGLITKAEWKCIDAVRKVRNIFAHHIDADFSHPLVKKMCANPSIYDGRLCDRDAFLHAAMNLAIHILYRDSKIRRRKELI